MDCVVRPLSSGDLAQIAAVHLRAFPAAFLTRLGQECVCRYYRWQLDSRHDAVCLGAFSGPEMLGFCLAGKFRDSLSGFLRKEQWFLVRQMMLRPQLLFCSFFLSRILAGVGALQRLRQRARSTVARPGDETVQASFGVLSLAVDPRLHGQGVGQRLLSAARDCALERGFQRMHLTVSPQNLQAIRFYEKSGWQRVWQNGVWNGLMNTSLEEAPHVQREVQGSVTVIVPCRNERKGMARFLDSLLRQDLAGIDLEVIVAEGMSEDGTREILRQYCANHPCIRVIDNPKKIVAPGLNLAIRAARNDVIVRMDAHTEYQSDYIRQCLLALERTGADNVGGAPRVKGTGFRTRLAAAAYHSRFAIGGARCHDRNYDGFVDTVFYGCWRRTTLLRLGLFDETLVRNQDDELNLRLVRAGGRIWQSSKIISWYQPRTTLAQLFRQYMQYGFWKVAVIRKHGRPASWRHLVPALFVAANLGLAFCSVVGTLFYSPLSTAALAAWAGMTGAYALASVAAACSGASTAGWLAVPLLPFLFAVYHVSYGVGFLAGLWHFARRDPALSANNDLFTQLTR